MKDYVTFCLTVILQRFGPSAHQVAQVLVQRNGLCLADIVRRSHLTPETVQHVLASLLQHDIIRVTAPPSSVKPDKSQLNKDRRAKVRRRPAGRGDNSDDEMDDDDYTLNEPASISGQTTGAAAGLFGDRGSGGPLSAVYRQRRLGVAHPCMVTLRDGNGVPIGNPGMRDAPLHKRLHYYLDLNIVRGFSRLTDYILVARRLWGDEGMAIVEEFAAMGKRTAAQVITAVVARIEANNVASERTRLQEQAEEEGGEVPLPDLTSLEVMTALPEGLLALVMEKGVDDLDADTRKRVIAAVSASSASLEEKVVKTLRKLIDSNYLVPSTNYCDERMTRKASRKRKLDGPYPQSGAELKAIEEGKSDPFAMAGSVSVAGAGAAAVSEIGSTVKSTPLTLSHDRFSLHMLSDMAYGYVAGLAGHDAARVTVALLKNHYDGGDKSGFTEDRILALVNALDAGELPEDAPEAATLLPAAVSTAVARLCHISMDVIAPIRSAAGLNASSSGPFYLLPERLLQKMRFDATKTLIRERCGPNAARVFALLSDKSRLEEKQVSDLTLIPKKEAKEALYSLLQNHFVELQEVPRTADRQPSKAFFLWSLPYATLGATALAAALRSWGNLQQRMIAESAPLQGLLDKTNARVQLSEAEHQKVNLWAYKLAKVDVVSRGLNQLILLFKDYTL